MYTVSKSPESTPVSFLLFSMVLTVFTSREPWLRQTCLGRPAGRTIRMGNRTVHRRAGILRHHHMCQILHPCFLLARIQSYALCQDSHLHPSPDCLVLGYCCCKLPVRERRQRSSKHLLTSVKRSSLPSSNASQPVPGGIASVRHILCSQTSTTAPWTRSSSSMGMQSQLSSPMF